MPHRSRAKPPSPFRCFNSSPEVIRLVVLRYVRFPLSLRNVEDLLAERGIDLCHETARFWWNRLGPVFAADIRRQRVNAMRGFDHEQEVPSRLRLWARARRGRQRRPQSLSEELSRNPRQLPPRARPIKELASRRMGFEQADGTIMYLTGEEAEREQLIARAFKGHILSARRLYGLLDEERAAWIANPRFLAIEPLGLLAVDRDAVPAKQDVQPPIAEPPTLLRQLA